MEITYKTQTEVNQMIARNHWWKGEIDYARLAKSRPFRFLIFKTPVALQDHLSGARYDTVYPYFKGGVRHDLRNIEFGYTFMVWRPIMPFQSFSNVESNCKCAEEEKHGWTTVKCCNHCGKSIESFWKF